MTWQNDLDEASDDLFDLAGEPATWNNKPITVLPGKLGETVIGQPSVILPTLVIQVREAELGARPKAGAVVVFRGSIWSATPYPSGTAGLWSVELNQEIVSL